jgi:hypothetical protein
MIEGGTDGIDNLALETSHRATNVYGERSRARTPMGPLRTCERGPRLRIAESDAHSFIGEGRARPGQAACFAHAQLVACNLCCDLWTTGRVSAYPAVQSFRLILLCGSQDECGGTAHRERIVWLLVPSPSSWLTGLMGRLTDGLNELLAGCLTAWKRWGPCKGCL